MSSIATSCPAWSIPGYLEVRNGHLNIDGVDALDLVAKYNSPLFVFSERRIRGNIAARPALHTEPIPALVPEVPAGPRV